MRTRIAWAIVAIACVLTPQAAKAAISDSFDSIDPAWVTDRYEPAGFHSVFFDGDNRLEISISDAESAANRGGQNGAFYNTQGRQRPASESTPWTLSADLYISMDMLSGETLRRTDLWARTGNIGNETDVNYPIIGMRRFDPSDPFNPAAANISTAWRIWDADTANGWVEVGAPAAEGWYNLSIAYDGTSFVYAIDGSTVYTDATVNGLDLTTVFLQAYNFADDGNFGGDYAVYWDNLSLTSAVVPEPATFVVWSVLGCVGAYAWRRRQPRRV